jgi:hypothetical protein
MGTRITRAPRSPKPCYEQVYRRDLAAQGIPGLRTLAMRAKKAGDDDRKAAPVVTIDLGALKGALKSIGGSLSDDWNNILAGQAMQTLWLEHSDEESRGRKII